MLMVLLKFFKNIAGLPTPNKGSVNISSSESSTPHWLKVAQSQIEAANKAILELTGMAGLTAPQPKVIYLVQA